MADTEKYQGWTNRETWCLALWLNNEQPLQEGAREVCTREGETIHEAAQSLEDYVEEMIDAAWAGGDARISSGMMGDMLNCALARVDFREIAATFRED